MSTKRDPKFHFKVSTIHRSKTLSLEICILAGGLSERMGRDKSRLRIGSTTMLGHIRKTARRTGLPVRVIRRDCVPKCGPLGGIYTALKTTKADAVFFLACDMPLVSIALIQTILRKVRISRGMESRLQPAMCALFVRSRGVAGFPFLLPREALESVTQQIQKGDLSLQSLAKALMAIILPLKRPWLRQLLNVNTPQELATLKHLKHRGELRG